MSNYIVHESLDTKKINLYNAANTFSYSISTPAITTNTEFPLPSSSGSTGEFLVYGTPSTWSSAIPSINTSSLPLNYTFFGGSYSFVNSSGKTAGTFVFPGTNVTGIPSAVYMLVGASNVAAGTTFYRIRYNGTTTNIVNITATTNAADYLILNIPSSSFVNPFPTSSAVLQIFIGNGFGVIWNLIIVR